MPPNTLLMCKLLLALLVLHGFFWKLADPHLPFITLLDGFRQVPGLFKLLLQLVFFAASVCLMLNFRVRGAAIALGITVLVFVLSSKPAYRNHILIVGCLLFLAGLHRQDEDAWLIKWQFAVMYFGAFLNKVFDSDWRTGQFIHGWLHGHLENPFYEALSPMLPGLGFAALLSWTVIVAEMLLTFLFAIPRFRNLGVGLALSTHLGFLMVVGRRPFGHFTEDLLIAMLVFLSWPRSQMLVRFKPQIEFVSPIFKVMNWDQQFVFLGRPLPKKRAFELKIEDRVYENAAGVIRFCKYNAAFYVGLFFAFNGLAYLISRWPF